MTVEELMTKLHNIGYTLHLAKEGIRFRYGREGNPPEETAILLSEAKIHKQEIIDFMEKEPFRLIEQTLIEINRHWERGTLEWMRRTRPDEFKKMINMEEEINRFTLNRDMRGVNKVLKDYLEFVGGAVRIFRNTRGKTGNLFSMSNKRSDTGDIPIH